MKDRIEELREANPNSAILATNTFLGARKCDATTRLAWLQEIHPEERHIRGSATLNSVRTHNRGRSVHRCPLISEVLDEQDDSRQRQRLKGVMNSL